VDTCKHTVFFFF